MPGFGWGNHAPQTAKDVAKAFYAGKACKRGNCQTDGETYWLYGNAIAKRIREEDILEEVGRALEGKSTIAALQFRWHSWPTQCTARHLNALKAKAEVRGGQTYFDGKPCFMDRWYTPREIEELPPEVVPPPRRRRNAFVQMPGVLF